MTCRYIDLGGGAFARVNSRREMTGKARVALDDVLRAALTLLRDEAFVCPTCGDDREADCPACGPPLDRPTEGRK